MRNQTTAIVLFFVCFLALCQFLLFSNISYAKQLKGRIVLTPEKQGEAWYISPKDQKRYYLGRPSDALEIMSQKGVGISNKNLYKIQPAVSYVNGQDSDGEGLADAFEEAVGTNINRQDTSGNGYNDKTEIKNGYNPLKKTGRFPNDQEFAKKQQGKILLQVEKNGEAWYVNPEDNLRYFLSRPKDAFQIMKNLSLGITIDKLKEFLPASIDTKNQTEEIKTQEENTCSPDCLNMETDKETAKETIKKTAQKIRSGSAEAATDYFIPKMEQAITYTINFLNEEGRYTLADILSGAKLSSSQSNTKKTFLNNVYFNGNKIPIQFSLKKESGKWLLTNL